MSCRALAHLHDLDPTRWLAIPRMLMAMGFPPGTMAAAVRVVSDVDIAALDPSLADDELVRIWRSAGAPTLTCNGFEIHFATPAELAASRSGAGLAGRYHVAARFANDAPAILLRVDDGTIAPGASRYACKRERAWDVGWELLAALRNILAKPIEKRLVSFIGKQAYASTRLGERVTLQTWCD